MTSRRNTARGSGRTRFALLVAVLALVPLGCESFLAPLQQFVSGPRPDHERAERERTAFRRDSDPAAIRWLLANRIESGMSVGEVESALGSPGVPFYDAPWKNDGGTRYHVTDEFHKWGPDSDGQAYYLAFRDGLLVNFEPREYE